MSTTYVPNRQTAVAQPRRSSLGLAQACPNYALLKQYRIIFNSLVLHWPSLQLGDIPTLELNISTHAIKFYLVIRYVFPSHVGSGGASLPLADSSDVANGFVGCPAPLEPSDCFLGGDIRVNEQTALTVMHTIFVREHNRIAGELQRLNPSLKGDEVFQLARTIVGAEIQKITYFDYLPALIGRRFFNQNIASYQAAGGYDPRIDATVPNAFAAAAYRYGHSQIQPVFNRLNENLENISAGPLNLVDAFFNPSQFTISEGTDPLLRGLLTQSARRVDEFVNSVLTTQLFASETSRMDLATLNIQRARDHGIPPYMVWRKWAERVCQFRRTRIFRNELTYIRLLQTYGSLDTVDLWVGGLAERPVFRGLVGPTFACIFANTFGAIRNGDRFYFENDNPNAFFTARQRREILRSSLSRIICDTADGINRIRGNAFRLRSPIRRCSQIPGMDLSVFAPPETKSRDDESLLHSLEDALAQDEPHEVNQNEKLIALLEKYTHELKGDGHEVKQDDHKAKQDDQADLLSELEDVLDELE